MKSDITCVLVTVIVLILTTVVAERNTCCANNSLLVGKNCQNEQSRSWASKCTSGGYIMHSAFFSLTPNDTLTKNFSGKVYNRDR